MNSKNIRALMLITGVTVMTTAFQNCSKVNFSAMSPAEIGKLEEEVFDANRRVAAVEGADGNPSENLRVKTVEEASKNFVQDCSKSVTLPDGKVLSRYDYEKSVALMEASMDVSQKTIPVEFAMSFGQAEDKLAFWAHKRAILSEGNDQNTSVIPVGPKTDSVYREDGKYYDAYYLVNHADAKNDYIYGKRCFFGTVKLQGDLVKEERKNGDDRYDFIHASETDAALIHRIHYMTFGWCNPDGTKCADEKSPYGPGNYGEGTYPNRLFAKWPHQEAGAPQIVKLYVADLRDGQFGISTASKKVIRLNENRERGHESAINVKKELDLLAIFRNRDQVIRNLSSPYTSADGLVFAGMKGVPQLITNINLAGASGTVLASQYTPIVLDLGREKVKTSSTFGGTYFAMAGTVPHQTAWLGGDLVDVNMFARAITSNDQLSLRGPSAIFAPATDSLGFTADIRRISDDGFLVMADSEGKVTSSKQLFGDKTEVDGKTYANGFAALQALAKKDCTSIDPKNRYVGPWDSALYSDKIKVWVDSNRNGAVDEKEVQSLKQAGVVAINACNIVHAESEDTFGNGTSLRSAFLFQNGEDITANEEEIVKRLETGKKSSGGEASFRLAIDLIFKANEGMTLE